MTLTTRTGFPPSASPMPRSPMPVAVPWRKQTSPAGSPGSSRALSFCFKDIMKFCFEVAMKLCSRINLKKTTALLLLLVSSMLAEARVLTDLVDIQGLRDNQLIGYGLVVGLAGTGDRNQVRFTSQSMTNMLKQFGVQLPSNIDPKLRN